MNDQTLLSGNHERHTGHKVKYLTKIEQITQLTPDEIKDLAAVEDKFAFRVTDYYSRLIDWNDPDDPLRKLVVPDAEELVDWGKLDASDEAYFTAIPGLEHKYQDTALLLCNDVCGAFCRYCFRKRLFMPENTETVKDVSAALHYIRQHTEINNVILSGGDPMIMSTHKLDRIIAPLMEIPHLKIVRIGTKMLAFNPYRVLDDPDLLLMLKKYNEGSGKKIYVMTHFTHPRELTAEAVSAVKLLQNAGCTLLNQTPLLKGINDTPDIVADLCNQLASIGIPPYYLIICRPTLGNKPYVLPIEEAYRTFIESKRHLSGLARTARLIMSPKVGKLEIIGLHAGQILFRYHRAAKKDNEGEIFAFTQNPGAFWFTDYQEVKNETYSITQNL